MNKKKQYIDSLLDNDDFLQWIIHPSELSDKYWNEIMENDTQKREYILQLKKLIKSVRVRESNLSSERKLQIWRKVEAETTSRKRQLRIKRRWITVSSVAASILILLSSYYLLRLNGTDSSVDFLAIANQSVNVGNDGKVHLVLPENKTIDIEEKKELVYDKNGHSNLYQEPETKEKDSGIEFNQLVVPYGKSSSVILSDGTKIWVNAGSRLIYPTVFSKDKREIYVEGEIYLEVSKNKHLPFIVKTSMLEVEVLGTSFNVQAYKKETNQSVVLVTGSVSIKNTVNKQADKISPSQMYSYESNLQKSKIQKVDTYDYICWKYGFLHFESEKLGTVLDKLGRYYNLRIDYDAVQTKNIVVSGKLNLEENVEEVFKSIALTAPFDFEMAMANREVRIKVKSKNN